MMRWLEFEAPAALRNAPRVVRALQLVERELVTRRATFRGPPAARDRRLTLVTVDYWTADAVDRLVRSFRRYVDRRAPVVVVRNSPGVRPQPGVEVVNVGFNLGHSYGLDLGMRRVRTEFTLVCDSDAMIVEDRFAEEVFERLDRFGVAGVDSGHDFLHPQCLAFRTEWWKAGAFSFLERWPWWDVGGELTRLIGGVQPGMRLPRTRVSGPARPSVNGTGDNHLGQVYADAITATQFLSRARRSDQPVFDHWTAAEVRRYHRAWTAWCEAVLAGTATLDDFPTEQELARHPDGPDAAA